MYVCIYVYIDIHTLKYKPSTPTPKVSDEDDPPPVFRRPETLSSSKCSLRAGEYSTT